MMRPNVLWIEDSAKLELRNLVGPVYSSRRYDFDLAEDVTTAVNILELKSYEAIVVDVRLPPGIDKYWRQLYETSGADKVNAQLGIKFLYWLLKKDLRIYPANPPNGILPKQVGIFTVEYYQDISADMVALGVDQFQRKSAGLPDTILLEQIDKLLARL